MGSEMCIRDRGWRAMNARLDRIEAAIARDRGNVVPLRGNVVA